MALLVLELGGSSLAGVAEAVRVLLDDVEFETTGLPPEQSGELNYTSAYETLDAALADLETGAVLSIACSVTGSARDRGRDHEPDLVLLHSPDFDGGGACPWQATIDVRSTDPLALLRKLIGDAGLVYAYVAVEELLDLERDATPDAGSFPWCDQRLVLGAVRSRDAAWRIQRGLAYERVVSLGGQ